MYFNYCIYQNHIIPTASRLVRILWSLLWIAFAQVKAKVFSFTYGREILFTNSAENRCKVLCGFLLSPLYFK